MRPVLRMTRSSKHVVVTTPVSGDEVGAIYEFEAASGAFVAQITEARGHGLRQSGEVAVRLEG